MKYTYILFIAILFTNCKNDMRQNSNNELDDTEQNKSSINDTLQKRDSDIKALDKTISIELKQKELIEKKDERDEFRQLIIDKREVINNKDFTINFKYPLLNEKINSRYSNFNDFIKNYYANVKKAISEIQESKQLCDSIAAKTFREERFIDYKIYNVNDQLVSVLFYKENFYSGAVHPTYSFDCFNFDLNRGIFMTYEDFFVQGTEDELLAIINKKIQDKIGKGDMYYDCWEVPFNEFFTSKNNFVLNDTYVEYYFDDCVMCPSYTGTYSIELPLTELLSVLKKSNSNPLVF